MKVLILSFKDLNGGAARAAFRLQNVFENSPEKINSKMRTCIKYSDKKNIIAPTSPFRKGIALLKMYITMKLQILQKTNNKVLHSYNWFPSFFDREINKSDADIVNLHWIQNEMISIESISRIDKPIVWTLHDTWAFCGCEHYPNDLEDDRYIYGYKRKNRPSNESFIDLNRLSWERKNKHWKKSFHIVCPSKWLAKCARESYLFRNFDISVIPNPLPLDIYYPWPKENAKKLFGFKSNLPIILFGALSGNTDKRKGWDLLHKSLKILEHQEFKFQIVILGQSEERFDLALKSKVTYIQRLSDDYSLAMLYSASDLVVVPSRMENLPQMATEAQACGVPVVGFNCTGLPDTVEHKKTGYLAKAYDTKDLANGIYWVLNNVERKSSLGLEARKRAVELWSEEIIVKRYASIFSKLKNKKFT